MSKPLQSVFNVLFAVFLVFFSFTQPKAQSIQPPQVLSFFPKPNTIQNPQNTSILVQFDQAMDSTSFQQVTLPVYGEQTGFHNGSYTYNASTQSVTFTPAVPFHPGELVMVILTIGIKAENGTPLASSFQWAFLIQVLGGSGVFQLDSSYTVEVEPMAVAIADFDNDGDLDFAVCHSEFDNVRILMNDGRGIFQLSQLFTVGSKPRSLVAADLNSDGNLDLAVANQSDNTVSILINQGDGSFLLKEILTPSGDILNFIIASDFNGDGRIDLATMNRSSDDVTILLNNGNASFSQTGPFSVGSQPKNGYAGDFNGDGFLDIVTANVSGNTLSFLAGNGDGTFSSQAQFSAGNGPRFIAGGDFNKDNNLDLAVANRDDNNVSILINNSDGTFLLKDSIQVGTEPRPILAKDFDADSDLDLVVSNFLSADISILLNSGSGSLINDSTYAVGNSPRFLGSGDFDADGDLDLAVVNEGSDNVMILENIDAGIANRPPDAPVLISPNNRAFLNDVSKPLKLVWRVPNDLDGDSLHFKIEFDLDANFNFPFLFFESKDSTTGFSPEPPVSQATDSVTFGKVIPLPNGTYWWRVSAWDGLVYGTPSQPQNFVIDTTPPTLANLLLPAPKFPPNWYNPNTMPSLTFGVQYDELYAQKAEFNLGTLGGIQSLDNIPSGSNQKAEITIDLTGKVDGNYPLSVTVFDSAGNTSSKSTSIALDSTSPSGTRASSPQISSEEAFVVNWGSTGTDGNGSGLSGIYDVKVQINGGAWQDWLTNFARTSATFQGSHGQTYGFEAVAYDNVGNVEAFSQAPESVTLVDTTADDMSAPGPPLSLTAGGSNPSPWQKDPVFQITWQEPDDPSKIARALYKLGNAPVTNYDTTGSVAGLSTIGIKADQEDGQNFYLWFVDGRGNVDYRNYGVLRLLYDSTLPEIKGLEVLNADFQPNWYNQERTSTAQVSVNYNEKHSRRLRLVSDGLGITIEADSLSSGTNASFVFNIRLEGKSDGLYDLAFTLTDSADNQTKDTTTIALDNTPPFGAQTSSPSTSSEERFVVTWGGTATDGNGSGLSGIYDVKVQIDGGAWQDWLTNFAGTSALFQGLHGQTYGFEAVAHDNVGNVESFSDNPESVTLVDTTVSDINAPGPPLSLTAGGSNPSPWQKDPVFQITWQAPDDPSGISKALYKLGDAPVSNYDTTRSVAGRSTVDITVDQEDGQNFYLWFVDGRGNVDFRNHDVVRLLYDSTLPEIKSINVLNADFQLTWFNQGRTSTAEIRVNYSERHPRLLRVESARLGTNLKVEDLTSGEGAFFLFNIDVQGQPDGMYGLAFTLIDSAGNQSHDTTTIALDNTPPVGARASSPSTSSQETFLVSWDGTATDGNGSGISGIYDVKVQINNGVWLIWLTNFVGTSADFRGSHGQTYGFEVVARDNVGNVEAFLDSSETITFVDTSFSDAEPPSIAHAPTSIVEEGKSLTIQAQINDNIRVSEAVLFYKQSGKKNFQSVAMTDIGGGLFEATLTPDIISTKGINYYIRASDGFNFAYNPAENWETKPHNVSVRISGTDARGLVKQQAQPGGSTQTAFRMISVPLTLNSPSPQAVLEDDLGSYDPKQWRLFQFKPSTDNYSEFPNTDPFSPGGAFWLIVREPNKKIDSGVGTTVVTNLSFQISLKQGWNDIGNPFNFPVDWSEVQVIQGSPNDIMGPYTYQGQWLLPNQVTSLIPWEGYAIFNSVPNVVISIPPVEEISSQNQSLAKIYDDSDWYLNITVLCEEAIDGTNFIGSSSEAMVEWDKLDYLEPPAIGEYVSLRFPHNNWQKFSGNFTTDFRTSFTDGQIWNLEVITNITKAPITLKFQDLESLPSNFQIVLLDLQTRQEIDVIQKSEYVFLPDQKSMNREFTLFIGTSSYLNGLDDLKQGIPQDFHLSQNFPNPFNAGTTLRYQVSEKTQVSIKVLNILGQEIRQLISKPQGPGFYQVHWDGKSESGKEVGTGIYIIKLDAGSFQQTRKVLLIR